MAPETTETLLSARELLDALFNKILIDETVYDQDIVALTKTHLGVHAPHSKAGNNLANALIELAKKRGKEVQQ